MEDKPKYYSPAQNRATQKYQDINLEQVRIWVRKGDKARLADAAKAAGCSVAQYVIMAVNSYAQEQVLTPSGGKNQKE